MKQKSIKTNAILNVIKQSLSVVFPLITYPYLSRVLGADKFGRYSFADSIVQIVITLSLIGIPTYAVREGAIIREKKSEISNFCTEIFSINVVSATISYLILFSMVMNLERFRSENILIFILSINIMAQCLGRDWINAIYEDYLYISIRYIIIHIVSLILILLTVKDSGDLLRYVFIVASSELLGNMINMYYTYKRIPLRLKFSKDLFKHLKPILILFSSSVATTIYIRSDIVILGFFCTDSQVGIYTISSKIYSIVKSIINAVIMVTIPRLSFYLKCDSSKPNPQSDYKTLLNRLQSSLILILLPASMGLFCLSSEVMYIIGGNDFAEGDISLKILCLSLVFAVFGCFFAHAILIVNKKETVFFKATMLSALINISLNFIFIPIWGINGAAFTTLLSEICIVTYCGYSARAYYKTDNSKLRGNIITAIIECLLIIMVSVFTKNVVQGIIIRVIMTIVISGVIYLLILAITKNELLLGLSRKKIKDNSN